MAQFWDNRAKGEKPCFTCDGTGRMCNVCGESQQACACDEMEAFDGSDCESCGGTGKAGTTSKPRKRKGAR